MSVCNNIHTCTCIYTVVAWETVMAIYYIIISQIQHHYVYMYVARISVCWKLHVLSNCIRHSCCTSNQFCIKYLIQLIHVFCVHVYNCMYVYA